MLLDARKVMPGQEVALFRGPRSLYNHRRPTAEEALLLVEVSDTTLATDREIKVPLYAEADIPQVWVVNLDKDLVEVYSEPAGGKYGQVAVVGRGQKLSRPGGLDGTIQVDGILE